MSKTFLVGIAARGNADNAELSLLELSSLVKTWGGKVLGQIVQKKDVPDAATFVGSGFAAEITDRARLLGADTLVFDEILRPVQSRNLAELTGLKTLDRTKIILDIFADRAHTKEGKLQVERAELTYKLSRLSRKGISLDSQSGGIGTRRGPGERKIENDKRIIRDRIASIDEAIKKIKTTRATQRKARLKGDLPEIAIAGYTNAGKSTLLKSLSRSEVYADDKLFATLDPLTRRVKLPSGRTVIFTDTVGFIQKLPHDLVAAFKSTMEEILRAALILHVVDVSNPDYPNQQKTVIRVLSEIGAGHIPVVTVYNKADKLNPAALKTLKKRAQFVISAKSLTGVKKLLNYISKAVSPRHGIYKIKLPYGAQSVVSKIYALGNVKKTHWGKKDITITFESSKDNYAKIKKLPILAHNIKEA
jgi:GTP-binding protein HflX